MSRILIAACMCLAAQVGMAQHAPDHTATRASEGEVATTSTQLMNPRPGVYTAAQPGTNEWKSIKKRGITTVVNLRPMKEMGGRDEAKEVRAEGMSYIEVPIFTLQDINAVNAKKLKAALNAANGKPVLVHCASGNRVGGLMALMAALEEHMPAEQAIALGKSAGMQSSEARVRELLNAPKPAPPPAPAMAPIAAPTAAPTAAPAPASASSVDTPPAPPAPPKKD